MGRFDKPRYNVQRFEPRFGPSGGGGSAPAAEAFDPVSLFGSSETGYIFDLSDTSTVFQDAGGGTTTPAANGDRLGTLLDLSPNGNHINAPTSIPETRPTYRSSGGFGYADFVASEVTHLKASFTLAQTVTYIASFRYTAGTSVGLMDGNSTANCLIDVEAGPLLYIAAGNGIYGDVSISAAEDFVITARFSGATSRVAKNSDAYASDLDAGTNNPGGVTFGSYGGGSGGNSDMRLYRAIGIGRDMTDGEIANARAWCQAGIP